MQSLFFREYIRMFSAVAVAMVLYYFTVNQWIEREANVPKKLSENFIDVDRSEQWWKNLYTEQDWQSQHPERLLTRRAEILYKSFKNEGPRRYRLQPLTILVKQTNEQTGQVDSVIMIDNPDGAEVLFDSDINIISQQAQSTSISSVHLEGNVKIQSMKLVEGRPSEVTMEANTSQLKIDGNRIWSTQEIAMNVGNSVFLGREFEFTSSTEILGKSTSDAQRGPFAGLDHLEIIYVNRVDLELPNGGALRTQILEKKPGANIPAAHLQVQCKKSFHFDFQKMLASLTDRVVMQHWLPGFPTDQIHADRIDLQFAFRKDNVASDAALNPIKQPTFEMDNGYLQLERIEAFGKSNDNAADESRWVQINAPNFMSACKTRWINLVINENSIELANRLPSESAIEPSPVYLERENLRVWSPKLIYKRTPPTTPNPAVIATDNASTTVEHLGLLWAQGPGEATMTAKDGDVWTANWANTLTMAPDGLEDLVTVDGAAQVRSQRQGRFAAEKFEIWLKGVPATNNVSAASPQQTKASANSDVDYQPTRMQAFKDVIVNSPTLRAQVAELKLWFEHVNSQPSNSIDSPNSLASGSTITPNGLIQQPIPVATQVEGINPAEPRMLTASAGESSAQSHSPNGNASEVIPRSPRGRLFNDATTVTGSTLEAKLILVPDQEPIVEHLLLHGGVTMTKERVSESFTLPATVTGDQIEVEGTVNDGMVFHIHGQPARVLIGGGNVTGTSIHFDQQRQLLYMDQPGEMTIPPELLTSINKPATVDPRLVSSSLQAPPLMNQNAAVDVNQSRWLEPPRVAWNGQMTFDGHLARLNQGVTIRGVWQTGPNNIWHLQSTSDEMYVEVSGNAFEQKSQATPTQVELVQLSGKVDVQAAQTDANMVRLSVEQLQLPMLQILVQPQTIVGAGPGSLLSRRFGNNSSALAGADATKTAAQLQCIHLTYLGQLDGSYAQDRVTFTQDVATILGPIQDWNQALNVDIINMPSSGQTKLETDRLSIYSTRERPTVKEMERRFPGTTKSAWEIEALGNLIVDSNTEQGMMNLTADKGRYDALYEVLWFVGAPTRPAHFRQYSSPSIPRGTDLDLMEGSFNLRTGAMQMSATNFSGGLPSKYQQPGPKNAPNSRPNDANQPAPIQSPRDVNIFQFQNR